MKTYQPKKAEIKRTWKLVDVKGKILGRIASEIATQLIGKNKVGYSKHMEMGDYVVVVNASDVKVSGKKETQKVYRKHSGYPGGLKEIKYIKMHNERPEWIIQNAVKGMLPDNRLKALRLKRLKVFAGSEHPYQDKIGKL